MAARELPRDVFDLPADLRGGALELSRQFGGTTIDLRVDLVRVAVERALHLIADLIELIADVIEFSFQLRKGALDAFAVGNDRLVAPVDDDRPAHVIPESSTG